MLYEALKASKGIYTDDTLAKIWGAKLRKGGVVETSITGNLPLAFDGLKAAALKNYRLYGTSEGSGVETENLFDKDAKDTNNGYISGHYIRSDGDIITNENWIVSEYTPVSDTEYAGLYLYEINTTANQPSIEFYDINKSTLGRTSYQENSSIYVSIPSNAVYFRASIRVSNMNSAVIKYGSTAPETYIPFGYQIPLTVMSGQNTDTYQLYIGSTKLGAEEYVDYASGKIFRTIGLITSDGKNFITADNKRFCVRRNNNG